MKLAEFKRTLKPGDHLTMLSHSWMPQGPLIGKRRRVSGHNTVGILVETEKDGKLVSSHLAWPKAAGFSLEEDIITYKSEDLVMTYKWERT